MQRFVFCGTEGAALRDTCARLAKFDSLLVAPDGQFSAVAEKGSGASTSSSSPRGEFCVCRDAGEVEALIERAGQAAKGDLFVMDAAEGWRVIPVENFVAARQQRGFEASFLVVVAGAREAETMLSLLDFGVDGVVLRSEDASEIAAFAALMQRFSDREMDGHVGALSVATVVRVESVGAGDRVCVDCCSSMREDEMLLVGNSSGALFGVQSEAVANDYVESRPFRFNAGPPHAYCLCPNGRTQYLSELKSGREVVVVRRGEDGTTEVRTVVVGRCKVERRPLLLVSATVDNGDVGGGGGDDKGGGREVSLFMQNAETCRLGIVLSDGNYSSSSVIALKPGDRVVVREDSSARHRGYAIEEFLVEQ